MCVCSIKAIIPGFHPGDESSNLSGRSNLYYFMDDKRHMVCFPYSVKNLHKMAEDLGIKKCWFHKNHYDAPLMRVDELKKFCYSITTKQIVRIIKSVK